MAVSGVQGAVRIAKKQRRPVRRIAGGVRTARIVAGIAKGVAHQMRVANVLAVFIPSPGRNRAAGPSPLAVP